MSKKVYEVTLSADAIVSATVPIFADSPEDAKKQALAADEDSLTWQVDSLHDQMENCGAVVYLKGKEVEAA